MFKKLFSYLRQKGQTLAFFAISAPVMFLFTGVVADFGWLYFNQSRLQNAADAAVVAGAQQLVFDEQNLSDYSFTKLVSNTDEGLARLVDENVISRRDTSDGDKVAVDWIKYNLDNGTGTLKVVDISPPAGSDGSNDTTPPEWNTVKFKHMLYGSDERDYKTLYYVISVSEGLNHIFEDIFKHFDFIPKLQAKAFSVVKISHYRVVDSADPLHGPSLYQQMKELRSTENYATWDHIKHEYDVLPKSQRPVQYQNTATDNIARARSIQAKGNEYVAGNFYRTETLTLHGYSKATNGWGKPNNNVAEMNQLLLDNLFVDFKIDIKGYKFNKDEDLGGETKLSGGNNTEYNLNPSNSQVSGSILNYRIHDLINIGRWYKTGVNLDNTEDGYYTYEYKVRDEEFLKKQGYKADDAKKKAKEPPDPLYIYIESENFYSHEYQNNNTGFNTVRQIVINLNASNNNENKDRPMFFFYDGPEKINSDNNKITWYETWRESWKYEDKYKDNARNSLPVIINFFEDFRGVFFFPNSPVVINGNGKKFEGFIVAQKYLRLKEYSDFPTMAEVGTESTERGCAVYKDSAGNVLYHKNAKGGKRYVQIVTPMNTDGTPKKDADNNNLIQYRNVIYAQGDFLTSDKDPVTEVITTDDNIYKDPDGNFVKLTSDITVLYTYTLVDQEKSNLLSTYTGTNAREKEYVKVAPMYVDQYGNVQYMSLSSTGVTYDDRPTPLDENWHKDEESAVYEVIYNPQTFKLDSVKYNGYNKVVLVDYTTLNNSDKGINDVFYTTVRSDWID